MLCYSSQGFFPKCVCLFLFFFSMQKGPETKEYLIFYLVYGIIIIDPYNICVIVINNILKIMQMRSLKKKNRIVVILVSYSVMHVVDMYGKIRRRLFKKNQCFKTGYIPSNSKFIIY